MLTRRGAHGPRRRSRGVTLVELMVVVAVVAVSATLAAPGISQLVANYRVRGAAESILGALNYARSEAVRRNSAVSFALTGSGSGWTVTQVSTSATLQSRTDADLSGLRAQSSNAANTVTFLPTGLVQAGTQMSQVNISGFADATKSRQINIFGGGLIRMCDPGITASGDPRKC